MAKPAAKVMALSDRLAFIRNLEIPQEAPKRSLLSEAAQDLPPDHTKQANVNAGSVQSFTANLLGQDKADVLNCTLLAQLAATAKYDRAKDPVSWYKFYVIVLEQVGWVMPAHGFSKFSPPASFTMDKAVVDLLTKIASDDSLVVAKAALQTLQQLPDDADAVTLFNSNSSNQNAGSFQIAPCTKDHESGQIIMSLGAFYFNTSTEVTRYLFKQYSTTDVELNYSTITVELNMDVFSPIRASIVTKLGDKAKTFIANLPI